MALLVFASTVCCFVVYWIIPNNNDTHLNNDTDHLTRNNIHFSVSDMLNVVQQTILPLKPNSTRKIVSIHFVNDFEDAQSYKAYGNFTFISAIELPDKLKTISQISMPVSLTFSGFSFEKRLPMFFNEIRDVQMLSFLMCDFDSFYLSDIKTCDTTLFLSLVKCTTNNDLIQLYQNVHQLDTLELSNMALEKHDFDDIFLSSLPIRCLHIAHLFPSPRGVFEHIDEKKTLDHLVLTRVELEHFDWQTLGNSQRVKTLHLISCNIAPEYYELFRKNRNLNVFRVLEKDKIVYEFERH